MLIWSGLQMTRALNESADVTDALTLPPREETVRHENSERPLVVEPYYRLQCVTNNILPRSV